MASSSRFKGTLWSKADSAPLKARKYTAQSTDTTLSRSEFVHVEGFWALKAY
jgi:hypothetical protein